MVLYVNTFSDNTGSGAIAISGLPFQSSTAGESHGILKTSYFTTKNTIVSVVNKNATTMYFHHCDSGGDYYAITHSAIANNSSATRLFASITYRTD